MGDIDQAIEWYLQLLGLTPSDPVILQKMGALFDNEGDKQQAYQYHFDSYRYFPSNLGSTLYFQILDIIEKRIINRFNNASFSILIFYYYFSEVIDWLGSYFIEMQVSYQRINIYLYHLLNINRILFDS